MGGLNLRNHNQTFSEELDNTETTDRPKILYCCRNA